MNGGGFAHMSTADALHFRSLLFRLSVLPEMSGILTQSKTKLLLDIMTQ